MIKNLFGAALLLATATFAQQSRDGQVHLLKVQGNIYMMVGAGSNITVQVGKDGIVLVDAGAAQMSDKVLAALKTISDKTIHYIIDSSFDADHTGGNENIARQGAPVVGGNLGHCLLAADRL